MNNELLKGIWFAVGAYLLWGVLPLFWKLLQMIPSDEILSHRIVWSFVFVMLIVAVSGRSNEFKSLFVHRKVLLALLLASVLISGNWFIYIWAVNHDYVIEASLGYYINPLLNVALGMIVLKERLTLPQWVAILLAATGVAILAVEYGKVPWIALLLAISFAIYGLVKKMAPVDAMVGLAFETAMSTPAALIYLMLLQTKGIGALGHSSAEVTVYLLLSGIATTLPLIWFAQGAKRIPFSMLAFIQYLSPTISLLLGIFVFHEPFTAIHLISFSFIWAAIVIYTLSSVKFRDAIKLKSES
ncbi:EamA family transporter RarD [Effusibacillus lacus]|uniref:Transporter n=1 Tax=Effusibacillus lacus TaxID=1348429 RepID=A0A292YCR3_9BACL|nr:EamA family transporter RarD [Effusibacillus lacus]TCS67768.1 chloramphenicol-sensitive protein RarD [Effusibacillus lacus]GAX89432.1 transporter [Effusibacillus lacus]